MTSHWPNNELTKLLHLDFPIIQAPMAGYSTPELVTGICYAGGLGSLGAGYMSPDEIRTAIEMIRLKTRKHFNINLFCYKPSVCDQQTAMKAQNSLNPYRRKLGLKERHDIPLLHYTFEDQIEVIIEEKVPIFSFTFGIPSKKHIEDLKNNGTILIGTATNLEEVKALEKNHIDAIVLQGAEAGGHRGTFLGSFSDSLIGLISLIPEARAITRLPLIAAGGIMNAQGIAAALLLGAQGVQLGTAFLACVETGAPFCYRQALLKFAKHPTVITSAFSGRAARVIKTNFLDELEKLPIADYPYQNIMMGDIKKKSAELSNADLLPLYAGEGFPMISDRSSLEIFYDLAQSTSLLFKELRQSNP